MRLEVHLNRFGRWPESAGLEPAAERAVRVTVERGGQGLDAGELSVTCLAPDEIRELNRRYLERDRPTDVLAFDMGGEEDLLGDVYLCPEVARESAQERAIEVREEILRLVIHGTLHVLGHDHPSGPERADSEMFRLQEALVRLVAPAPGEAGAGGSTPGDPAAGDPGGTEPEASG